MSTGPVQYEVAISLLKEDLTYAKRLETALRKVVRGKIFLYKNRQNEVAADAEMVAYFNRVFMDEARLVVILYRPGWGETPFTQIEENAIHAARVERGGGMDFIFMVAMEPPEVPAWFTTNNFFSDPETFSAPAVAAQIAARVRAVGGTIGPEPPAEYARRKVQERQAREEVERRMRAEGRAQMETEVEALFAELKRHAGEVTETAEPVEVAEFKNAVVLTFRGHDVAAVWKNQGLRIRMANDEGTRLVVTLYCGRCGAHGRLAGVPTPVRELTLRLALTTEGAWGFEDAAGRFYTAREVAHTAVLRLIDQAEDPAERWTAEW